MTKIISYRHSATLDIQPFAFLEVAGGISAAGRRREARVISSADVTTVSVRAFDFYGSMPPPAEPTEAAESAEPPLQPVPAAAPEVVEPAPASPERAESADAARAEAEAQAAAVVAEMLAREREQIVQQAQEEAAQHLATARAQAAALTAEAYAEGLRQGEAAARREVLAQLSPILTAFQQAAAEITQLRATVLQQAEEDVLTLAFQLARKIVQHEVSASRRVLAVTLRRALMHVVEQDAITVRVHPDDLMYATELQHELRHTLGALKALTIQSDTTVGRGGCIVDSSLGTIDARIEAQFDELERHFRRQYSLDLETHAA